MQSKVSSTDISPNHRQTQDPRMMRKPRDYNADIINNLLVLQNKSLFMDFIEDITNRTHMMEMRMK